MAKSIYRRLSTNGRRSGSIPAPLHSSLSECFTSAAEIADYCTANAAAIDRHRAFPVHEFSQISDVELDSGAAIAEPEDYNRQPWLTVGSIRFAAVQLGGAEALFDSTRQYLHRLNRTKDSHQQSRIAQMALAIESGNLWLKGAADQICDYAPLFGGDCDQSYPDTDRLVTYINMARTAIEQICMDVIQLCERSVGTNGLLPPYPMERIIRDLSLYLRQPGFDAALDSVGKYALAQPQSRSINWHEPD